MQPTKIDVVIVYLNREKISMEELARTIFPTEFHENAGLKYQSPLTILFFLVNTVRKRKVSSHL